MNLVDWFKGMIQSRRGEDVVDPLIAVQPPPRAMKRALLVCLRCIDLDVHKRPKMGQIVHMLEADDFPFRSVSLCVQYFIDALQITCLIILTSFFPVCYLFDIKATGASSPQLTFSALSAFSVCQSLICRKIDHLDKRSSPFPVQLPPVLFNTHPRMPGDSNEERSRWR